MTTWRGKFKPIPGFGQTLGSEGTIVQPPSSSVDKVLGLAPSREGTDRFLWDYNNKATDEFLQRVGQLQFQDDRFTGSAVTALTGLNPASAARIQAQRNALRRGTARAFMGPDGSFQYRDLSYQGDRDSGVLPGSTMLDGRGSYDPVSEALSSNPQSYQDFQGFMQRAKTGWKPPLWLSLSRSMGGGTLPPGAWRNT